MADIDLFDDLEDLEAFDAGTKSVKGRKKFSCVPCGGTGKYRGARVHQTQNRCFACNGRGYFLTSPELRQKARARNQQKKQAEIGAAIERHVKDGSYTFLVDAAKWSSFAESLLDQINRGKALSDKQHASLGSMIDKAEKREAEKAKIKKAEQDVAPRFAELASHFLIASANLKWPKLRLATADLDKIVLSRAGPNSRNPGHINVTDGRPYGDNRYYGRIDPEGRAFLRNDIPPKIEAELVAINDDPAEAIRVTGTRTGQCCCCGRELTNPVSIENGIGPICANGWGF